MKFFDMESFCNELVQARGSKTQTDFSLQLGINRSTLSLLENGKQMPTLELLGRICEMTGKSAEDFFKEKSNDALVFLMGNLEEADKEILKDLFEKIRIKEKYGKLAKRGRF